MRAETISYPGVGVTAGGVLGFLGVVAGWFSFSYPVETGIASGTLNGMADWTGAAALTAAFGAFAFGGAYLLMNEPKLRRLMSVLMAVSSAFLLIMSIAGYQRIDEAVGTPAAVFASGAGKGLVISFAGGVIAMVGSLLASREIASARSVEPEASPVVVEA